MKINDKRVLITGGSSGIGLATAKALAAKGARLVIAGRREHTLSEAATELRNSGAAVHAVTADVTTAEGRTRVLRSAQAQLGGLDIIINNAGGVRAGRLENISEATIRAMIEVNLIAPILLTRAALPDLRRSSQGLIVNVTSGIALTGVPFYCSYAAAKSGFARFGEALRRELKGEGIHVLTVYPGATETPLMASSKTGSELGFTREPASTVAAAIIKGIEIDAFEVTRGGQARAKMVTLNRDDPAKLDERFLSLKDALENAVRDHQAL